jgi:site-specific DNA-cytosine methylase
LASLRAKGHNPDRETWIIDIFGNWTHGMLGKSPCLTRTRAAAGGHWITTRSRLMSVPEMLRLQGMSPALNCVGITERQMGCMIGNAMSVNVLERLLVRLLPAVGLVSGTCLRDRWA